MTFTEKLSQRILQTNSRVCLGIDPRPDAHPLTSPSRFDNDPAKVAKAVVFYFQGIIESTHDLVACYKLQSAFFEALGIPGLIAMAQLIATIKEQGIPVILDAKRGDIGSTAEAYARAYLGDGVFSSDALTVNPFLGMDTITPFVSAAVENDRGIFVLVKTSNPGSKDLQDVKDAHGTPLYMTLAAHITQQANEYKQTHDYAPIGVVIGATHPQELQALRTALPYSYILVPGYGAQGGDATTVKHAFDRNGTGAIISSSRGLTYTSTQADFTTAARNATQTMRDAINTTLESRLSVSV